MYDQKIQNVTQEFLDMIKLPDKNGKKRNTEVENLRYNADIQP
jgi:hypothetical protein